MKKITGLLLAFMLLHFTVIAQSFAINTTGAAAHGSAILDVSSISKGLLIPRLTTAQRTGIALPGKGLLVYDSTLKSFYFHDGVNWQQLIADSNNLWRRNGNDIYKNNTGNVGIGISTPKSLLNVRGGAVLFDSTIGGTPVSGAGTRMMWIPAKAAFRAGGAFDTDWDDANIGIYSFAAGYGSQASGSYSVAMVNGANATGISSVAIGSGCTSSGTSSTTFGEYSMATNVTAVAMGYFSNSSGIASLAAGNHAQASGRESFAMGNSTTSSGSYSVAMGYLTRSSGNAAVGMGDSVFSSGNSSFATGYHTNAGSNYSTAMGNGTNASGLNSTAMGYNTDATNSYCTAMGNGTNASGLFSTAMGVNTTASGVYSTTMGNNTTASSDGSTAMGIGTTASGYTSTAIGYGTTASGYYSSGIGLLTKSKSYGGFAIGIYNDSTNAPNSSAQNSLNRLFQIGNGTWDGNRSNAMTVLQNGNIGIGEVNPTVPLNFESALGDKIALWGNGSNHYGLGIQPSLLQVYTMDGSNDIAFGYGSSAALTENVRFKGNGNVGIGTNAPTALLDVNGTTTTNGLQVSNGTVFTKMQSGSATVGASATAQLIYSFSFPVAFVSATPKVFATARNEPASSFTDAFSVSIRAVSATTVTLNIQRTDSITGWGQQLRIDWFAVE